MNVAIVGGGPAGLMAAEVVSAAGASVDLYDAMPSVGRKFLLAGKGGLNLTHSEPAESFLARYGPRQPQLAPIVTAFGPDAIRQWALGLGVKTFVGTSRRILPADMKSAPLLRAWLRRLRKAGVRFHVRHRWDGWNSTGDIAFAAPTGTRSLHPDATILALGGGSWPKLGSNGAWVSLLQQRGVAIAPLRPANCGFDVSWSAHLRNTFAGHPIKSIAVTVKQPGEGVLRQQGECVVTESGLEGGVIYAVASILRDEIEVHGSAVVTFDLAPDLDQARLIQSLSRPRGKKTVATHLRRYAGITGVKSALLHEVLSKEVFGDPARLAVSIKALPVTVSAPRPLDEAISTAGGVRFESLDNRLMLRQLPGVFCAGEMLDWEAPTGGYLLTACLATGRAAGLGAVEWLTARTSLTRRTPRA